MHFEKSQKPTTKCFSCLVIDNYQDYFCLLTTSIKCKYRLFWKNPVDFKVARDGDKILRNKNKTFENHREVFLSQRLLIIVFFQLTSSSFTDDKQFNDLREPYI